ncbi:mitogen-activated protein kinase kinase kinase [Hypoxylon texense]
MPKPAFVYNVLWAPGVKHGSGRDLPANWKVVDPKRIEGQGTPDNPKIYYVFNQNLYEPKVVRHTKRIVSAVAKTLECTHIWVRGFAHEFTKSVSKSGVKVVKHDHDHITVGYGKKDSTVLWEGHLYVKRFADGSNAPKELTDPKDLPLPNPWLHAPGKLPYDNLPKDYPHTFCLAPNRMYVTILPPPHYHTSPKNSHKL